jgi:hypothetical protein
MSDGLPASESKAGQYAAEAVERARVDIWKDEPPPLVLFESRAAWGVSRNLCSRYSCKRPLRQVTVVPAKIASCGSRNHLMMILRFGPRASRDSGSSSLQSICCSARGG